MDYCRGSKKERQRANRQGLSEVAAVFVRGGDDLLDDGPTLVLRSSCSDLF